MLGPARWSTLDGIRLRSKVTDAGLPIEVKIAENWTVEELEEALTDQLCGQYLRSADARHGILLITHLKSAAMVRRASTVAANFADVAPEQQPRWRDLSAKTVYDA